jgi:S-adenosylmethionine decarboxylase
MDRNARAVGQAGDGCPPFFEGSEKKLEIILGAPRSVLRRRGTDLWPKVVSDSGAGIIGRLRGMRLDAYLLTESSLFVWDDRVLMITCGRTTPVTAMPRILAAVGAQNVAALFYERKNMLQPANQPFTFRDDLAHLQTHFEGQSIRLGPRHADHLKIFFARPQDPPQDPDATLQVLMNDLHPRSASLFHPAQAAKAAGTAPGLRQLESLLPGMRIQRHFFKPCGYSLNGIQGPHYYTVHVTPQAGCAYASFETNRLDLQPRALMAALADIFAPGRITLLLTSRALTIARGLHGKIQSARGEGYRLIDCRQHCFGDAYRTTFMHLARCDGPGYAADQTRWSSGPARQAGGKA